MASSYVFTAVAVLGIALCAQAGDVPAADMANGKGADVARGRYLTTIGGCNDCHTAGYAASSGEVPEAQWLLGDGVVGFRGPWGTTYAPNLRRIAASMSESQWVKYVHALKTRPPMPWFTLSQWKDDDLRALYRYIRKLGPPGEAVTSFVPPDAMPQGPFILWPAPPK